MATKARVVYGSRFDLRGWRSLLLALGLFFALLLSTAISGSGFVWEATTVRAATSPVVVATALAAPDPLPCLQRREFITATFDTGLNLVSGVATIRSLEVSQGITVANNDYVTDHAAAVLASIDIARSLTEPLTLMGCLHVRANGHFTQTLITREVIRVATTETQALLVFEPLVVGTVNNVDLYVEVIDPEHPLTRTYDVATKINLHFVLDAVEPLLFYIPVNFGGLPEPNLIDPPHGDAMLRSVLPVGNQPKQWWYLAAPGGPIPVTDVAPQGKLICNDSASPEQIQLMTDMHALRQRLVTTHTKTLDTGEVITLSIGSMEHKILYGWVGATGSQQPLSCNGLSAVDDGIAFGSTSLLTGQRTFAHEIFHHVYAASGDTGHANQDTHISQGGWDVGNHLPGSWQIVGVLQRRIANDNYVMMTTADLRLTHQTWIGGEDYQAALAYFCAEDLLRLAREFPDCPADYRRHHWGCLVRNNYVYSGFLTPDGVALLAERSVFQAPWYSQPTSTYSTLTARPRPFAMIFSRGEQRIAAIGFDATVITERADVEDDRENFRYGFFSTVVPDVIVRQADRIEIQNINGEILPFLERSPNRPEIEIIEPESAPPPLPTPGQLLSPEAPPGETTEGVALTAQSTLFQAPLEPVATPSGITPTSDITLTLGATITVLPTDADGGNLTCSFTYSPDAGATWLPIRVQPLGGEAATSPAIEVPCTPGVTQQFTITNRTYLPDSAGRAVLRAFVNDGFQVAYSDAIGLTVSGNVIQ